MSYDIQLNVRLSEATLDKLRKAAGEVGTTPSQIAREAIIKELKRRDSHGKNKGLDSE